jgi:protein-S-isoprenylcysteine O-methyltransferase Ste14
VLKPDDYQFLRDRRRLIKNWPLVGGSSMLLLLATYAWLAMQHPALANPVWVYNGLMSNEIGHDVLVMLAMLTPILLTMIFVILGLVLTLGFSIMRREKRLLDMVDHLIGGKYE